MLFRVSSPPDVAERSGNSNDHIGVALDHEHLPLRPVVEGKSTICCNTTQESINMPEMTWNWQPLELLWGTLEGIREHFQEITGITGEIVS